MPTVKELRQLCKENGIKGYSKLTKQELEKKCKETIITKQTLPKDFKPMLANKYTGEDPSSFYISEKLDGIRALYDPNRDIFISRNNKIINHPPTFTKSFPKDLFLDGELYTKRGDFAGTGIFRKKIPIESEWKNAIYMVFDLPLINEPFENRYEIMKNRLKNIPYIHVVEHIKLRDAEHLRTIHNDLVSQGAEGTMLRRIGSYYENRRSNMLLKLKDFQDDEVMVLGYETGSGKYKKHLGALHVKWLDESKGNSEFNVGSGFTDNERINYKKIFKPGTIITIQFFETDKFTGKPRFPTYKGIRGFGKTII